MEKNDQIVPLREISLDDVQEITWTVHLANRKASFYQFQGLLGEPDNYKTRPPLRNASVTGDSNRARQLEIDEGEKVITATKGVPPKIVEFKNSKPSIPIETLGELRTDDQGRLLVLGGKGRSAGKMVSWTRNLSGSYLDMVNKWSTLRFVVKEGNAYIEQQET